jgi:hypothetical protein
LTDNPSHTEIPAGGPYLAATMEYGEFSRHLNPFNIDRFPTNGSESAFIHPVPRWRHRGQCLAEHHIPEDLENRRERVEQFDPALDFLKGLPTW